MKFNAKKQLMPAFGLAAGGIGANFINQKLAGTLGNDKIRGAALLGVGIFLSMQKGDMMKHVGSGFIAVSAMKLVGSFVPSMAGLTGIDADILNGIHDDTSITAEDLSGVLNGVLNGDDDGAYGVLNDDTMEGTDGNNYNEDYGY